MESTLCEVIVEGTQDAVQGAITITHIQRFYSRRYEYYQSMVRLKRIEPGDRTRLEIRWLG